MLLLAALRQPRSTNQVHPSFGHEVGAACHEPPREPPESRPCGCSSQAVVQEQAAVKAGWRAAIIVITHNEAGCVLRRTLMAVLARTPPALLQQLLVLDDAGSPPAQVTVEAAGGLSLVGSTAARLVQWQRGATRLGVMIARSSAVSATSAPVLVLRFLAPIARPWPASPPPPALLAT